MAMCGPAAPPKIFVLCFDGTGNKFSGTDSDSNILKIYRMLDRTRGQQFHYYQPGIGTYTTSASLSHTSFVSRMYSWYLKSKDSAIGSSFDAHVMGGYKFLMRYYSPGDDIYFFGFSRGAYIARFLAEMLDYVGLLSAGNEELIRFAWKTFATWQQRHGDAEKDEKKKRELFHFMKVFRETFSRPVRRIRFLGLFDTVNSVPRFENAWMRRRNMHPYTARSSAKVIRHAVGIDERRAKFRQDLICETKVSKPRSGTLRNWIKKEKPRIENLGEGRPSVVPSIIIPGSTDSPPKTTTEANPIGESASGHGAHRGELQYRPSSRPRVQNRDPSLALPMHNLSSIDLTSLRSKNTSTSSLHGGPHGRSAQEIDDSMSQDVKEVWFSGGHADIGGGWPIAPTEIWPLSHVPLVWMVQEAEKAGLNFDKDKMLEMQCCEADHALDPNYTIGDNRPASKDSTTATVDFAPHPNRTKIGEDQTTKESKTLKSLTPFLTALHSATTRSHLHDPLSFSTSTLPTFTVLSWHLMEYLPFRRMDLQPDGTWQVIRWPLPKGEVRDIPATALIHNSVIERMKSNRAYRPGNLIVGGAGGRGVRVAPDSWGMGSWVVWENEGNKVAECFVRRGAVRWDGEGENGKRWLVGLGQESRKVKARKS